MLSKCLLNYSKYKYYKAIIYSSQIKIRFSTNLIRSFCNQTAHHAIVEEYDDRPINKEEQNSIDYFKMKQKLDSIRLQSPNLAAGKEYPKMPSKLIKAHGEILQENKPFQMSELNGKNINFNENLKFFIKACLTMDETSYHKKNVNQDHINAITNLVIKRFRAKKYMKAIDFINELVCKHGVILPFESLIPLIKTISEKGFDPTGNYARRIFTTIQNTGLPLTMMISPTFSKKLGLSHEETICVAQAISTHSNINLEFMIANHLFSPTGVSNQDMLDFSLLTGKDPYNPSAIDSINTSHSLKEHSNNLANQAHATLLYLSLKAHIKLYEKRKDDIPNTIVFPTSANKGAQKIESREDMDSNTNKNQNSKPVISLTNIKPFNIMLETWANLGNIERIEAIYHLILFNRLTPNAETFSHLLYTVAKNYNLTINQTYITQFIHNILTEMENLNIHLDELFQNRYYFRNELDMILNAINLVQPHYKPLTPEIIRTYDTDIFKDLPSTKTTSSQGMLPYSELLTKSQYDQYFREQLRNEMLGYVKIKSIFAPQSTVESQSLQILTTSSSKSKNNDNSIHRSPLGNKKIENYCTKQEVANSVNLVLIGYFIYMDGAKFPKTKETTKNGKYKALMRLIKNFFSDINIYQPENIKKLKLEKAKWQAILQNVFRSNLKHLKQAWDEKAYRRGFKTINLYPMLKILPEKDYIELMINGISKVAKYVNLVKKSHFFDLDGFKEPTVEETTTENIYEIRYEDEIEFMAINAQYYSPSSIYLYKQLGYRVNQKYIVRQKLLNGFDKKLAQIYDKFFPYLEDYSTFLQENPRTLWSRICLNAFKWSPHLDFDNQLWASTIHIGIGKYLYSLILQNIKVEIEDSSSEKKTSPAFFSIFRQYSVNYKEEFKPHPNIVKLFKDSTPMNQNYLLPTTTHIDNINNHNNNTNMTITNNKLTTESDSSQLSSFKINELPHENENNIFKFETHTLPMLVPPIPWSSIYTGGYLLNNSQLVRISESWGLHSHILANTPVKNLLPALDALTYLGMCPWIINQKVLDVIIHIFNTNGNMNLGIPGYTASLNISSTGGEETYPICTIPSMLKVGRNFNYDPFGAASYNGNVLTNPKIDSEMYSLWCDTLYKLSIANHLRNRIFWFPHNMDFRSRVYPIPPYFNHLSGDPFRSLFLFAKGQPLGPNGLRWLKLHLVNLLGTQKKKSIEKRLQYVDQTMPTILACAENPLKEGNNWWMKADDPWQTLACCMEIKKALASPNPAEHISHFPIHQDGSCNGLQHYAALGRDADGGNQVNLTPHSLPQDVYTAVAEKVEKLRKADDENGNQTAIVLRDKIGRKVVKQTVMTVVYGVTHFGAKEQISKQIEAIDSLPYEVLNQASRYLVEKTFASIKELFTATREIQDWFTDCARHICQNTDLTLEWVTPIGFPVVQPYSKRTQSVLPKVHLTEPHSALHLASGLFEKPITRKQKNAFPPNFIHSLDSSHMMLTALHCQTSGINFVAVHDCFWTHANHVEIMNKICREQFVLLHSQPILENLSKYFVHKYGFVDKELNELQTSISNSKSAPHSTEDMLSFNQLLVRLPKKGSLDIKKVLESTFFFS